MLQPLDTMQCKITVSGRMDVKELLEMAMRCAGVALRPHAYNVLVCVWKEPANSIAQAH